MNVTVMATTARPRHRSGTGGAPASWRRPPSRKTPAAKRFERIVKKRKNRVGLKMPSPMRFDAWKTIAPRVSSAKPMRTQASQRSFTAEP